MKEAIVTKDQHGVIEAVLPRDMYRVRLDDGRVIRAGVTATLRHSVVRLIAGHTVTVRLSPNDNSRGQITQRT